MKHEFLPARYFKITASYASAGIAIAELSLRMSVCPSHSDIVSKGTKIYSLAESPKTIGVDLSLRLRGTHNGEFSCTKFGQSFLRKALK